MSIQAILFVFAILFSSSYPVAAENVPAASHVVASGATQPGTDKNLPTPTQEDAGATNVKCGASTACNFIPGWGAAALIAFSYLLVLIGVTQVTSRLISAQPSTDEDGKKWAWSLAQALSEEVAFTTTLANETKTETRMIASTSRVIALFGLVALLVLFMAFGSIAMWYFATSAKMPDFSGVLNFFYAGAGLFVPYGLNQFKAAFEAFSPKAAKG